MAICTKNIFTLRGHVKVEGMGIKRLVKHKRVGGNGLWCTLCGQFGRNAYWFNTWKAVNCKKCLRLKGTAEDSLREGRE